MASEVAKSLNGLVLRICEDRLQRHLIKDKCRIFLTEVTVPSGWEDTGYKLDENCPSYKYRLEVLKKFVERKKTEGFESVTSETSKQFFDELRKFSADSGSTDSFPEFIYDSRQKPQVDLFEQNIRLQGVVVHKFSKDLKASVLIKTEDYGKRRGHGSVKSSLSELVVKLQDVGDLVEGDVVEVTKCRRKEGEAWEPEVIKYVGHHFLIVLAVSGTVNFALIIIFLSLAMGNIEGLSCHAAFIELGGLLSKESHGAASGGGGGGGGTNYFGFSNMSVC